MSNVGQSTLVRFGKVAFTSRSSKNYSSITTYSPCGLGSCVDARGRNPARVICEIHSPVTLTKRYLVSSKDGDQGRGGTANDDCKQGQGSYSRSTSSSYQEYHRRQYERKKFNYDQNRNQSGRADNTMQSGAGPSMTHYQRLNIDPEADIGAIKSAYYSLSKEYHPDIVGSDNPNASENFRLITESYDVLSDEKLRTEYDKQLGIGLNIKSSFTGVTQSSHPNKDFNPIFRARDADTIFRSRQEAAIEMEKIRNPKKFRAGSFGELEDSLDDPKVRLEKLNRRLQSLKSVQRSASESSQKDGSDFYRMHLEDTIYRKVTDLSADRKFSYNSSYQRTTSDSSEGVVIVSTGLLILLVTLCAVNMFVDIDLAGSLDSYFSNKFSPDENPPEDGIKKISDTTR